MQHRLLSILCCFKSAADSIASWLPFAGCAQSVPWSTRHTDLKLPRPLPRTLTNRLLALTTIPTGFVAIASCRSSHEARSYKGCVMKDRLVDVLNAKGAVLHVFPIPVED